MEKINKQIQQQFAKMCSLGKLFKSSVPCDELWDLYLKGFKEDPVFRDPESSVHNCNNCKNFIRRYGNIVAIDKNYQIISLWDSVQTEEFSGAEMSKVLLAAPIEDVFLETFQELKFLPYESCKPNQEIFKLGVSVNYKKYTEEEVEKFGQVNSKDVYTFTHLHLSLPNTFVSFTKESLSSILAIYRTDKEVFQRAMETISLDTLLLVKDLINQQSLLNGDAHLYKIEQFIPLKTEYDTLPDSVRDNWCWTKSHKLPIAKFRNELIGTLCSDLSKGMELNKACQEWNKRVDPVNYMKATAPITKKQIEEAKKFVEENEYVESFNRRFATIDDIKASDILHISTDSKVNPVSIFDSVKSTSTKHKKEEFGKIEEVPIEKFMRDILPSCTSVEAYLENRLESNMMSLTTSNVKESKPIFKWDNNYSWTFNGNIAGKSEIKEVVKTAGGNVSGILRFSLLWNFDTLDNSDLDAWCVEPRAERIGYSTDYRKDRNPFIFSPCGGQLDLDNITPSGKLAVENIYYKDLNSMKNGNYLFYVNVFANRNLKDFKAEIEVDGESYTYYYDAYGLFSGWNVNIAQVTLDNGVFKIEHLLEPTGSITKEIYGLNTQEFHKVNLVCLSPNHWTNNVGNKHYFFMLENCKSPVSIRSFHNENLIPELAQHRKVLEILGNTTRIKSTDKQLSGLGFNATVRDELIVRLKGSHNRVIKIKF